MWLLQLLRLDPLPRGLLLVLRLLWLLRLLRRSTVHILRTLWLLGPLRAPRTLWPRSPLVTRRIIHRRLNPGLIIQMIT
ncbi:hypothetical protein CFAL_08715 [Corynebacterium falsenii DSM 44353]|nr:hypothetical protein CFAL_08715 [Corynebacterium falsenii DSM 44353]